MLKVILAVSVVLILGVLAVLVLQPPLGNIQKDIEASHQDVKHIEAQDFARLSSAQVVVFDVREPEEYAVSHIDGAIHVSPDIDPQEFADNYADLLNDKQAVFYCSVGRRSSDLIARLSELPEPAIAQRSVNLAGGVFNWVNQGHSLKGGKVHPYNDYWGRLIKDQTKISYSPTQSEIIESKQSNSNNRTPKSHE